MVRLPRFFAKKRGDRRTGAAIWGSVGEAVFHLILVGAGLVFGGLLISGVAVPEWRINHDFLESRGTVIAAGVARLSPRGEPGREPRSRWQPFLKLRYATHQGVEESWAVAGSPSSERPAARQQLDGLRAGVELPCWYDPAAPREVVLRRGYNWWMWALTLLLPSALVAFGGAGLARAAAGWGKSEERMAAGRGLGDSLADGPVVAHDLPGVPSCDDLVNSPGTVLPFRLPTDSPESWTLLGFGLFAGLWNIVLVVLAINAGLDLLGGQTDRLLLAVLVPFAAVGITGIVVFTRALVVATAVGTTQLEISAHPLRPGGQYEVLLGQGGSGALEELEMTLELEERATYRQGTDTRTERLVVWRQVLGKWERLQVAAGTRCEVRATLQIPATGMHSFVSEHNSVGWRVVVQGRPSRWPRFRRSFPVVVFPPLVDAAAEQPPTGKGNR
jgi:hypothetical protein